MTIPCKSLQRRFTIQANQSYPPSSSPSVYIVFQYVVATNNCGPVGTAVTSVTVAANPSEVSSYANNSQSAAFPFNFADLNNCPQNVSQRTLSATTFDVVPSGGFDACQPDIVINGSIWDYAATEPAWASCTILGVRGTSGLRYLESPFGGLAVVCQTRRHGAPQHVHM